MTKPAQIIGLAQWLKSPAGRYLLAWEQRQLDAAVADVFGFHALQLGLPELDALRANRMPHRWLAVDGCDPRPDPSTIPPADPSECAAASSVTSLLPPTALSLHCDFDALPFDSQSLDLVVLPHALELARDPHLALGEVQRVLRPEGRVVIVGFNPASLWSLRQRLSHLRLQVGLRRDRSLYLPNAGEFLAYRRLRDWLRLLSFEVEAGRFGCYRPPFRSERWLTRMKGLEETGHRWWPVFGAVYLLVAVKRVRGMRLVGLARAPRAKANAAPAVVAHHHHHHLQPRRPLRPDNRPTPTSLDAVSNDT